MENMKITLPNSGYIVELRGYMDVKTGREYRKTLLENIKSPNEISDDKDDKVDIPVTVLLDSLDVALRGLLIAVYDKEGNKLDPAYEKFSELPMEDGDMVYAKVGEIIKPITDAEAEDQKKIG